MVTATPDSPPDRPYRPRFVADAAGRSIGCSGSGGGSGSSEEGPSILRGALGEAALRRRWQMLRGGAGQGAGVTAVHGDDDDDDAGAAGRPRVMLERAWGHRHAHSHSGRREQQAPAPLPTTAAAAEAALAALQAQRRELEAKTASLRRAMHAGGGGGGGGSSSVKEPEGGEDTDADVTLPLPARPLSLASGQQQQQQRGLRRPPPPPPPPPLPPPPAQPRRGAGGGEVGGEDDVAAAARWVEQKQTADRHRPRLQMAWALRRWCRGRAERAAAEEQARRREHARLCALQRRALVRMRSRARVRMSHMLCIVRSNAPMVNPPINLRVPPSTLTYPSTLPSHNPTGPPVPAAGHDARRPPGAGGPGPGRSGAAGLEPTGVVRRGAHAGSSRHVAAQGPRALAVAACGVEAAEGGERSFLGRGGGEEGI